MYTPAFSDVEDDDQARAMVAEVASGWLVTAAAGSAPTATLLPILWRGSTVLAHMAKANAHWREIGDGAPGLVIVGGAEAYVSPSWYPSKAEHGKVVPTWNYLAVHLTGTLRVHRDPTWLRDLVTELTDVHEDGRADRWHVTDAPADFIDTQLRAIIGVEMSVERVQAKAKLSQNRSDADQRGVIAGLLDEPRSGATAIAAEMRDRSAG